MNNENPLFRQAVSQNSTVILSYRRRLLRGAKIIVIISLILMVFSAGFFSWFTFNSSGLPMASVLRFDGSDGMPDEIIVGPDRHLWFNYALVPQKTSRGTQGMRSITPDGRLTGIHIQLIAGFDSYMTVKDLSIGVDGAIWGMSQLHKSNNEGTISRDAIWRIDPETGNTRWYPKDLINPTFPQSQQIENVVSGQDGFIWYTESTQSQDIIGRFNPQTGEFKNYVISFAVPAGAILGFGLPERIAEAPNGDIWFTRWYDSQQGRIQVLGRLHSQTDTFSLIVLPNVPKTIDRGNLNGFDDGVTPRFLPTVDGGAWVLRTLERQDHTIFTSLEYVSSTGTITNISAPDQGVIKSFALASNNRLWVVYGASYRWPLLSITTNENRLASVTQKGNFMQLLKIPGNGDITNITADSNNQLWAVINNHPGIDIERITLP